MVKSIVSDYGFIFTLFGNNSLHIYELLRLHDITILQHVKTEILVRETKNI